MMCAWDSLLEVLPPGLRGDVDRLGKPGLQELRLRLGREVELVMDSGCVYLDTVVASEDLAFLINAASRYSPWACKSMEEGFLTIAGGHRIGLGGGFACTDTGAIRVQRVTSLCLRVAKDIPGIGKAYADLTGSTLILGPPGWGKTTLLRDLARQIAERHAVAVIDDRGELFPQGFARGKRMDVLSQCPKEQGIDMALRTLGPEVIAVDEVTQMRDCQVLAAAAHCGVRLLATAHGASSQDLTRRDSYKTLVEHQIFDNILVLGGDRTCTLERGIS